MFNNLLVLLLVVQLSLFVQQSTNDFAPLQKPQINDHVNVVLKNTEKPCLTLFFRCSISILSLSIEVCEDGRLFFFLIVDGLPTIFLILFFSAKQIDLKMVSFFSLLAQIGMKSKPWERFIVRRI